MADGEDRCAAGAQFVEKVEHEVRRLVVEAARGLIREDDLGFVRERPGHGHPLTFPTRHRRRSLVGPVRQVEPVEEFVGACHAGLAAVVCAEHRRLDVLERGEPGDQVVELEHQPDLDAPEVIEVAGMTTEEVASDLDGAGVGLLERGEQVEQRRLAGTGGAGEHGELAASDLEVDVVEGDRSAVPLRDVAHDDARAVGGRGRATHVAPP